MTTPTLIAPAHALIASAAPDAPALVFPDQTLSHGQVSRLGQAFARRMTEAGIGPGSQIYLDCIEPTVILATVLGASWVGAQLLPYGDADRLTGTLKVTHQLGVAHPDLPPKDGVILIDQSWSPASTGAWDAQTLPDPDAPFLCVHTSGTTGTPKYLCLSQAQVLARSRAVSDEFQAGSRHALLFAAYSRPFLARALAALLNVSTLVFNLAPKAWAAAEIDMVSGSRAQVKDLLGDVHLTTKCRKLEVIGSRLPDQEAALLLRSFDLVDDTYGASETSKSYSTLWTLDASGRPFRRSGMRDSRIQLIGAGGQPAGQGEDGMVLIRNDYMAAGYVDDPIATAASFRDGWFYSGDMAWQDREGCLHFRDRMDHIVNLRGEKLNASAIDQILRSVEGIHDAICFRNPKPGSEDELFAFVVYEPIANRLQAIATARYLITERFGQHLVPRVIQGVQGIPREPDGTPDRRACADLILSFAKKSAKSWDGLGHAKEENL